MKTSFDIRPLAITTVVVLDWPIRSWRTVAVKGFSFVFIALTPSVWPTDGILDRRYRTTEERPRCPVVGETFLQNVEIRGFCLLVGACVVYLVSYFHYRARGACLRCRTAHFDPLSGCDVQTTSGQKARRIRSPLKPRRVGVVHARTETKTTADFTKITEPRRSV